MKIYADTPALRTRQALGDLACLAWVAGFVLLGRFVTGLVDSLAGPVGNLRSAGVRLGDAMRTAQDGVDDLPLVGDTLKEPFRGAASTGDGIVHSSDSLVAQIHTVATWTGLLVALVPIVLGVGWWAGKRLAFVRTASLTQRFIDADADLDLFALRAIANQPLARLDAVSHDPVGAWRDGDLDVIRSLAALELRDLGLRPPKAGATSERAYLAQLERERGAGGTGGTGGATSTTGGDATLPLPQGSGRAGDGAAPAGPAPAGPVPGGPTPPGEGPVRGA